jgi:multidrug efflux pump subunit AcrA (membrane-fusion protein)
LHDRFHRGVAAEAGFCRSAPSPLSVSFASVNFTPFWRRARPEPEGGAMTKNTTVVLVLLLAAGCVQNALAQVGGGRDEVSPPPMDPKRKVSRQVCTRTIQMDGGNLLCIVLTDAQRRAEAEEAERQAQARREAEERAARERLERERAEQLAREEAARKQQAAEEERLAAERRRVEAEAAAAAAAERERQERAAAEARARQLAEQEAREAAERECRRLAQERLDGRALLVNFVDNYGKIEENKGIAGQITAFLGKVRKVEPCPSANPSANSTQRLSQTDNQLAKSH